MIYVATSWRNGHQQEVVAELRRARFEVIEWFKAMNLLEPKP